MDRLERIAREMMSSEKGCLIPGDGRLCKELLGEIYRLLLLLLLLFFKYKDSQGTGCTVLS